VLDAEHGMQIIVVLDDHAGAELGRRNRHCWFTSPSLFLEILGSGAGRVASAALRVNNLFYTGFAGSGNQLYSSSR
jgi:hypothetical protein